MVVFSGSVVHALLGPDAIQINTHTGDAGIYTNITTTNLTSQNSTLGTAQSTSITNTGSIQTQTLAVLGNTTISGNLTVAGTTTSINSTNIEIQDKIITLGKTTISAVPSNHISGIEFDRGISIPKYNLIYQESDQTIRAGLVDDTLPLMVRENIPLNLGFFIWDTANYKAVSKSSTESRTLLDVFSKSEINNSLALKSNTDHNHNELYYIKAEIADLLAGKSDTSHNHNTEYNTKSEITAFLAGKLTLPINPIDNGFFMWDTATSTALTKNSSDSRNYLNVFSKTEIYDFLAGKLNISSTTDLIGEGTTNLYHTPSRVRGSLSSTSPITYNNTTGIIGLSGLNTSSVGEGTNLYYTDSRARTAFSAGSGISINSGVISSTLPAYTLPANITLESLTITSYYRNYRNSQDWYFGVGAGNGNIHFNFLRSGFGQVLTLNDNGNVGIGDISPTDKLHVNGNVRVNGKIINHVKGVFGQISYFYSVSPGSGFSPVYYLPDGFTYVTEYVNIQPMFMEYRTQFNIPSSAPTPSSNITLPCVASVLQDSFSLNYSTIIRTKAQLLTNKTIEVSIFTAVYQYASGIQGASLAHSVNVSVPIEYC